MHLFIKKQITIQQNDKANNFPIDEQNAYDEFIFFAKMFFVLYIPMKAYVMNKSNIISKYVTMT